MLSTELSSTAPRGSIFLRATFEEVKFVLSSQPKSTQHIYGLTCRGRFAQRYMTPAGKTLKEQYQMEALAQWKGKPLAGDIEVLVTLYLGTKRKADLANFNKLTLEISDILY